MLGGGNRKSVRGTNGFRARPRNNKTKQFRVSVHGEYFAVLGSMLELKWLADGLKQRWHHQLIEESWDLLRPRARRKKFDISIDCSLGPEKVSRGNRTRDMSILGPQNWK